MGEAIIAALLDGGLLEADQITGSEPYADRRAGTGTTVRRSDGGKQR